MFKSFKPFKLFKQSKSEVSSKDATKCCPKKKTSC